MLRRIPLVKYQRGELVRRARKENLSPDDIEIYPSKKLSNVSHSRGEVVARGYNALAISKSQRFTLYKYGAAFTYHDYKTRAYDTKAMCALFGVDRSAIMYWVKSGYLAPAMINVRQGGRIRLLWLYHQVQPMYMFYCHEHSRRTTRTIGGLRFSAEGIKRLHIETEKALAAFRRVAGLPSKRTTIRDEYREVAGLYGVIWHSVDK